jgi:chromosome segregation ATPase
MPRAPLPELKSIFSYDNVPSFAAPAPAPVQEDEPEEFPAAEEPAQDFVEDDGPPRIAPEPAVRTSSFEVPPLRPRVTPPKVETTWNPAASSKLPSSKPAPAAPVSFAPPTSFAPPAPAAGESEEIARLKKELEGVTEQRDQNRAENKILREQLRLLEDQGGDRQSLIDQIQALSQAAKERDEAKMEEVVLRDQLRQVENATRERDALASQLEELSHIIDERDAVRRDYIQLRKDFENLKQEQIRRRLEPGSETAAMQEEINALQEQLADQQNNGGGANAGLEEAIEVLKREVDELRNSLAERDEHVQALETDLAAAQSELTSVERRLEEALAQGGGAPAPAAGDLPADVVQLQELLAKARQETSAAQRGLALSQKALAETRNALKENSEGSAVTSRATLDNLKSECATLTEQNMTLHQQNEQLTRELNVFRAKIAAKS